MVEPGNVDEIDRELEVLLKDDAPFDYSEPAVHGAHVVVEDDGASESVGVEGAGSKPSAKTDVKKFM